MSDNERYRFPELLDCRCRGEKCAISGCYFENIIKSIDKIKMDNEKIRDAKKTFIDMAQECDCKKILKLMKIER